MTQTLPFDNEMVEQLNRCVLWYLKHRFEGLRQFFDPEEIVSEVTVKFLERKTLERYDPARASLATYLFTSVRNVLMDLWAREMRRVYPLVAMPENENDISYLERARGYQPDPEDVVYLFEILEVLRKGIPTYGTEDVQTSEGVLRKGAYSFYTMKLLGYTRKEIAETFGVAKSWVGRLLTDMEVLLQQSGVKPSEG